MEKEEIRKWTTCEVCGGSMVLTMPQLMAAIFGGDHARVRLAFRLGDRRCDACIALGRRKMANKAEE